MLRPATDGDKESVRVWRNHPEVRQVSLTQDEITPDEHERYWASIKNNPSRRVFMFERSGQAAGVVTFFDIDDATKFARWGFYLDNAGLQERGELFPAWIQLQREAVRYAFGDLALDTLEAEVLDANDAVRRMNRRNGFEEVAAEERLINDKQVLVHTVRRRRQPHD